MPVILGARPQSGFDDPLGLLSDCHRRIESFLGVLIRVTDQAAGGELGGEQRTALETALRYFREAAPKHTRDEEESLFPRMREVPDRQVQAALRAMARLERDHAVADTLHEQVDRIGRRWLEEGRLGPRETERLGDLLLRLQKLYQEHISLEDQQVFPLAAKALDASQLSAVGAEMAARRGLTPPQAPADPAAGERCDAQR